MGSGQSSVKGIHIDQSNKTSQEPASSKKRKNVTAEVSKDSSSDEARTTSNNNTSEKDAEIASLTKQLCECESQKLDLEDRVQALEERIEYLNTQTLMTEAKPCDETLHVKDQYISKLEKEKADIETESNKMRQKLRRKIKQLNSQMAEFKQESHFEMMEFKDEIQRLTDENQRLKTSANSEGQKQPSVTENSPKLPGGEKMKLILELSEQVTEQGDKISKLEKKVKDRDQVIEDLRVKLRNKTDYLTAMNHSGLTDRGDRNNNNARVDRSSDTPVRRYWGSSSPSHSGYKSCNALSKKESDVDDLFAVQGDCNDVDDDFNSFGSMKKLSELLQGTKSDDSKTRESLEALNSDRQNSNNHLYQIVEEPPESGTGRDSGLGSAGKRESENTANNDVTYSYLNWKESSALSFESEFSDSDSVTGLRSQTKVSSAPPKLQNQGSTKSKKKSHILKKHMSLEKKDDRPPRPGRAFVNSNENNGDVLSSDRILSSQKFLPVLSPVNVS